jgi:biopolymer transport protein ExbB/TolQ
MEATVDPSLAVAAPAPEHDLSLASLFLHADPIVQAVIVLLALASIACWAIMFDKAIHLARLRRQAARLAATIRDGTALQAPGAAGGLIAAAVAAGLREAADRDDGETRAEARGRCERAMRAAADARLRAVEPGLPFLATVGSTAPFVGLFGTVLGIMNSFTAIAATNDTSLSVVAPGIAEALFATAIGLAAAIPAVVAYNKLTSALGRLSQGIAAAIPDLAAQVMRQDGPATKLHEAAE